MLLSSIIDFIVTKKIAFIFLILAIINLIGIYRKMKNKNGN